MEKKIVEFIELDLKGLFNVQLDPSDEALYNKWLAFNILGEKIKHGDLLTPSLTVLQDMSDKFGVSIVINPRKLTNYGK